jgi:hypothetical protein
MRDERLIIACLDSFARSPATRHAQKEGENPGDGSHYHPPAMQTESDHNLTSKLKVELLSIDGHDVARQTISMPRTWTSWSYERKEDWKRGARLGKGGGGEVYVEECVEGEAKGERRAVKVVKRIKGNFKREIEAAMLFSHSKVEAGGLPAGTLHTLLTGLTVPRKLCQVVWLVVSVEVFRNLAAHTDLRAARHQNTSA